MSLAESLSAKGVGMVTDPLTKARQMIAARTDDQLLSDLTQACIENRRSWDEFNLVNRVIDWILDELDERFTGEQVESIETGAWFIADSEAAK